MDGTDLARIAETSYAPHTIGQLRQVCDRWLNSCLHFALSAEEQLRSGFAYNYALFQLEFSRNLLFHQPTQMEQIFNSILDRSRSLLDIKQLKTIFGRKRRPHRKKAHSTHPITEECRFERPTYNMSIFKLRFGPVTLKLYTKGEALLRSEVMVNNVRRLHKRYSLANASALFSYLRGVLYRFLNQLAGIASAFVHDEQLATLHAPSPLGKASVAGLALHQPRLRAVMHAVVALAPQPRGFSISQLAQLVRQRLQLPDEAYSPHNAAYDLRKLRAKLLVDKIGGSRRYQPSADGLRTITALLLLHEQVRQPLLAAASRPQADQPKTDLDIQYGKVQAELHQLYSMLGFAVS